MQLSRVCLIGFSQLLASLFIQALGMGNLVISRILPGEMIGEFRMDVKTVYNAPGD